MRKGVIGLGNRDGRSFPFSIFSFRRKICGTENREMKPVIIIIKARYFFDFFNACLIRLLAQGNSSNAAPVQVGTGYGYGGRNSAAPPPPPPVNSNYGYGSSSEPPPPPPPPDDDVPMPPEYSYPRFLEPSITQHMQERTHNFRHQASLQNMIS